MLTLAHVGLTVGAARLLDKRVLKRRLDYRLVALMAVLPDVIDRFLYIFVIPGARTGRLIAHTLLFHLVLVAALRLLSRRLYPYGLAALGHILLDLQGLPRQQLLWPVLGLSLERIGIRRDSGAAQQPYGQRLRRRVRKAAGPYLRPSPQALVLEAAGLIALAASVVGGGHRQR